MDTTSMSTSQTIYAIKDRVPEFPCWVWHPKDTMSAAFWHLCKDEHSYSATYAYYTATHWSPDAPEAPKGVPESVRQPLNSGTQKDGGIIATHIPCRTGSPTASPSASPVAGLPTPETSTDVDKFLLLWSGSTKALINFARNLQDQRDMAITAERRTQLQMVEDSKALAAARAEVEQERDHVKRLRIFNDGLADECNRLSGESDRGARLEDALAQLTALRAQLATAKEEVAKRNKQLATIVSDETFPRTSLFDELTMRKLRAQIAKANAAVEAEKEAADKWREYYRKAYGHPWENRNSNYQGL